MEQERQSVGEKRVGAPGGGQVGETVQTLSRMIKDLEEQLDRMLSINESNEQELERERGARRDSERRTHKLEEQIVFAEQQAAAVETLKAEVDQAESERLRLASRVEELTRELADTEQQRGRLARQNERLRAAREDSLDELATVEAQFERAMKMVGELSTRLTVLGEERDALTHRLRRVEDDLRGLEKERDSLTTEVDESRGALEEIRRSLAEACVVPQRAADQ